MLTTAAWFNHPMGILALAFLASHVPVVVAQCVIVTTTTCSVSSSCANAVFGSGTYASYVTNVPAFSPTFQSCAGGYIAQGSGILISGSATVTMAATAEGQLTGTLSQGANVPTASYASLTLTGVFATSATIGSMYSGSVAINAAQVGLTINTLSYGTISNAAGSGSLILSNAFSPYITIAGGRDQYVSFGTATAPTLTGNFYLATVLGNVGRSANIGMNGFVSGNLDITATSGTITAAGGPGYKATITGDSNTVYMIQNQGPLSLRGNSNLYTMQCFSCQGTFSGDGNTISVLPSRNGAQVTLTAGNNNQILVEGGFSYLVTATVGISNTVSFGPTPACTSCTAAVAGAGAVITAGPAVTAFVGARATATLSSGVAGGTVSSAGQALIFPTARNYNALNGAVVTLAPSATVTAEPGAQVTNTNPSYAITSIGTSSTFTIFSNMPLFTGGTGGGDRRKRRHMAALSPDQFKPQASLDTQVQQVIAPLDLSGFQLGHKAEASSLCRNGLTRCPVLGGGFVCVDTMSDIQNCGGCYLNIEQRSDVDYPISNSTLYSGIDCTTLTDVDVVCLRGRCRINKE